MHALNWLFLLRFPQPVWTAFTCDDADDAEDGDRNCRVNGRRLGHEGGRHTSGTRKYRTINSNHFKILVNAFRGPFHKPKRIRKLQIVYHCTDDLHFDLFGLGIINSLALVD